MDASKGLFLHCIESTLRAALCITDYPSAHTEGDAVPEVELDDTLPLSPSAPLTSLAQTTSTLRGRPLRLQWAQGDECLIEATYNSTRVSWWFAAAHLPSDPLTTQLLRHSALLLCRHGAATAPLLTLLRCEPLRLQQTEGAGDGTRHYDISLLVLPDHVQSYGREEVARFIVTFARTVEADVAEMKTALDARRRAAAKAFFA
ncbi:putative ARP2/3 complex subunit [Leptomonas seymouri]|uniref:Putative ARP2/3 complex subunit n=1 Tax=Leptomonas seymouri TaxID=5684 RepID=A0A0N1PAU0_LEPSE|nr:putative ARP2/3 complex subunit [Leptomonas seymouri]|eukprot:KPI84122.1 putative ARP2/3 complex subunit [Leptomonas seymouri]